VTATAFAIVVAAGTGERLGADVPKALVEVGGRSLAARAVDAASACSAVLAVVVAAPRGLEDRVAAELGPGVRVVSGGSTRHASVRAALDAVDADAEIVLVHDAARPFATPSLFSAVIEALGAGTSSADGVVPVVAVADTVKRVRDGWVVSTEAREELGSAQTPQGFRAAALREAHARAVREGREFTDDAAAVEWAGFRVRVVDGEPGNFKITTAEDLARASEIAERAGD
jgi:2-C-methyl-D-erythritol 4-phosphate cytidylyltransferase